MSHTALIRLPEVLQRVGLRRSSIYRWVSDGHFPAPVKLGPRVSAWVADEVEAWLQTRIEASRLRSHGPTAPPRGGRPRQTP